MVPVAPAETVAGIVMGARAVPGVSGSSEAAYVHETVCPVVVQLQLEPVAVPGVIPAGNVSVKDAVWLRLPPLGDTDADAV
jgi:hypothetical protein